MPAKFSEFFVGREFVLDKYLIYDPDTINGVIQIEGKDVTFPFRMLGYDSIEKTQKKSEIVQLTEAEADLLKAKYMESETLLNAILCEKPFKVKCGKLDLYGRILCDAYVDELHVN